MLPLLWLLVLGVVFAACRWSGRLLDAHYADGPELGAVALVAVCVLGPLALGVGAATLLGVPARLLLAITIAGGLLSGRRAPPTSNVRRV
jgi:hypothetical protein